MSPDNLLRWPRGTYRGEVLISTRLASVKGMEGMFAVTLYKPGVLQTFCLVLPSQT